MRLSLHALCAGCRHFCWVQVERRYDLEAVVYRAQCNHYLHCFTEVLLQWKSLLSDKLNSQTSKFTLQLRVPKVTLWLSKKLEERKATENRWGESGPSQLSVGKIRNLWVKVLIIAIYNSCVSMETQNWFSKVVWTPIVNWVIFQMIQRLREQIRQIS